MGVADYGVNGNTVYSYQASTFESWTNFTALKIGLSKVSCEGSLTHCMSIQQNLVDYNVYETHNKNSFVGEYWPQDVPVVTQSGSTYVIDLFDNIWNLSSPTANMKNMIYPNLLGDCSQHGGHPVYYFCQGNLNLTTTLPFEIQMKTTTGILPTGSSHPRSSYIEFGIWVYHNGKLVKGEWFDEVAFNGPAKSAPYIKVGGMNPYGLFNDAETVFCGNGGGSAVGISKVSAKITESYIPLGSTTLTPISHAWSAGSDTAETVKGVQMTSTVTGAGVASAGADNNAQLW